MTPARRRLVSSFPELNLPLCLQDSCHVCTHSLFEMKCLCRHLQGHHAGPSSMCRLLRAAGGEVSCLLCDEPVYLLEECSVLMRFASLPNL